MKFDVVLPTYNRCALLPMAIDSFFTATAPDDAETRLVVVDNNSRDDTRSVVEAYIARYPGRICYLFAGKQGREHALQAGIVHSSADVIAMFDDDEAIRADWLVVLTRNFADPGVDYVGGEMRPNWLTPKPDWLPPGYSGVVGVVWNGDVRRRYGTPGFSAMPVGGNMAVRRSLLERCRPLAECTLQNAEDRFLYNEFQRLGAVGYYDPDLVVLHQIPAKRVTKTYHRFWALAEGRTHARVDLERPPASRRVLGVPFWRWRKGGSALLAMAVPGRPPRERFAAEMRFCEFLGYLSTVAGLQADRNEYRTRLQ